MKLASGFCIPEPLPVHTGIKGRQVHPLIRFYAEEPRRVPGNQRWFKIVAWGHNVSIPSIREWELRTQMLTSECVTDKCHARGCNLPTAPVQIRKLVPTGTTEYIAAGDSQAAVPFPTESEGILTFSERQLQVFPICCYSLL